MLINSANGPIGFRIFFSAAGAKAPATSSQSDARVMLEHMSGQQPITFDHDVQPRIIHITRVYLSLEITL